MYRLCSIDGEIVDASLHPHIGVNNRAFLYGDGVFETIPWRDGDLHLWDRHINRLLESISLLGLIPPRERLLEEWVLSLLNAAQLDRCMVRITSVPQAGGVLVPLSPAITQTVITLRTAPTHDAALHPIIAAMSQLPFRAPRTGVRIKGGYAHVAMESRRLAMKGNAARISEILFANEEGRLVEGGTSNLVAMVGKELVTPPLSCGILPGVTRGWLIEQATRSGIGVTEDTIPPVAMLQILGARLYRTNSAIGVQPIGIVDDLHLPCDPYNDPLAVLRGEWWG